MGVFLSISKLASIVGKQLTLVRLGLYVAHKLLWFTVPPPCTYESHLSRSVSITPFNFVGPLLPVSRSLFRSAASNISRRRLTDFWNLDMVDLSNSRALVIESTLAAVHSYDMGELYNN